MISDASQSESVSKEDIDEMSATVKSTPQLYILVRHNGPSRPQVPLQMTAGSQKNRVPMPEPVASPLCTKVCGDCTKSKSCSKICLIKVYPTEYQQQAIKMYAMLDNQSNKPLARSEFFDLFRIEAGSYPYTLKTCTGLATKDIIDLYLDEDTVPTQQSLALCCNVKMDTFTFHVSVNNSQSRPRNVASFPP